MKQIQRSLLIAAIFTIGSSLPFFATDASKHHTAVASDSFQAAIEEARPILEKRLSIHPGLSVAVAVDRKLVWSEAMGWADREKKIPARVSSEFRLYSVAKSLTGVLALRLVENGHLDLDAPIETYLELPPHLRKLTTRQLLGHLGGIRHYKDREWMKVSTSPCATAREALLPFVNDPLINQPGSELAYSSFGFVLASAVLEAAGSKSFYDLLDSEISKPAEMNSTRMDSPDRYGEMTAAQYWEGRRGRIEVTDPRIDNSCKVGAGGLLSTSEDLVRFGTAILDGSLLDDESVEVLFVPQKTSVGESTGYSLGWGVRDDGSGGGHSGGSPGGRSYLYVSREPEIVIAIMSNFEGENLVEEVRSLLEIFTRAASQESE